MILYLKFTNWILASSFLECLSFCFSNDWDWMLIEIQCANVECRNCTKNWYMSIGYIELTCFTANIGKIILGLNLHDLLLILSWANQTSVVCEYCESFAAFLKTITEHENREKIKLDLVNSRFTRTCTPYYMYDYLTLYINKVLLKSFFFAFCDTCFLFLNYVNEWINSFRSRSESNFKYTCIVACCRHTFRETYIVRNIFPAKYTVK